MQYLKEYASDVLHLIKFGTQVSEIQAQSLGNNTWMLKSENLLTGERKECIYDAIVVCSGHYDVCYIPTYAGIREWDEAFPNRISHSKNYRSADAFHGKKILVVGSGPSSSDIASQISTRAKYPVLLSQRSESVINATVGAQNHGLVRPMGQIAEFIHPSHGDRAVRFVSGHVESGIDSVMFATGYLYNFPFLKSTALDLIDDGMRVKHLYQHMFHINHPSLIFAGLPIKISVFSLAEAQAPVIARVLSGRLKLPSKELMSEWERATLAENGEGRAYMSMSHLKEYLYQRMLCDWANEASPSGGKLPHKWSIREAWIRERLPIMSRAFKERGDERHKVMTIEDLGFDFDKYQSEKGNLYSKL
jgi:cation diffusion facilitator CzcD-associated flavoprotein CzcO